MFQFTSVLLSTDAFLSLLEGAVFSDAPQGLLPQ